MIPTAYSKGIGNKTIAQLESEVHKVVANAISLEEQANMPIAKIEEAYRIAIQEVAAASDAKCKFRCKVVYPPGVVECVLECEAVFTI